MGHTLRIHENPKGGWGYGTSLLGFLMFKANSWVLQDAAKVPYHHVLDTSNLSAFLLCGTVRNEC
jgi:hypothetical protein